MSLSAAEFLARLKASTAALHLRAEAQVDLLEPGATVETYRRYLEDMLGWHAGLEAALARSQALADWGFDAPSRSKQRALETDLRALGADPAQVPVLAAPAFGQGAQALGAAYVVEGSTLGGQYILRRIRPLLGPELVGRASAFLDCYGERTGPMWRAFKQVVEAAQPTGADCALAEAAACECFEALIGWIARGREARAAAGLPPTARPAGSSARAPGG